MVDTVTRQQDAYGYFISKGLTPAQSAGITANLIVESNIDPCSKGDSGLALGIAQWHPDRRATMPQCFSGDCHSQQALDCQLNLIWTELQGSHSNALTAVQGAKTPSQAAQLFANLFEVCGDCHMSERTGIAEALLKDALSGNWGKYAGSDVNDAGVLPVTTDNPLSVVGEIVKPITDIGNAISALKDALTSRKFWTRIGEFLLGAFLFLVGVGFIFSESKAGGELRQAATTAAASGAAA